MKVSYKGVTGELLKLEREEKMRSDVTISICASFSTRSETPPHYTYRLEIEDGSDGHKHSFENVDISKVKFVGVTVTIG